MKRNSVNLTWIVVSGAILLLCAQHFGSQYHYFGFGKAMPDAYEAILTCGGDLSGSYPAASRITSCFSGGGINSDTVFEIKNGDEYGLYAAVNVEQLGKRGVDGYSLHIPLKRDFSIRAQNASSDLILNVKVVDLMGQVKFQQSAAKYGLIQIQH